MYKRVNNERVKMTPEEEAELAKLQAEMPVPEKTAEERLAELEQAGLERDMALAELAEMIIGGGF